MFRPTPTRPDPNVGIRTGRKAPPTANRPTSSDSIKGLRPTPMPRQDPEMDNFIYGKDQPMTLTDEPALLIGSAGALITAVMVVLISFGVPITGAQQTAILALVAL